MTIRPPPLLAEMADGEAAEVGAGLEVDGQRARPGGVPVVVGRIVGDGFEDAGIVDQHVDPAAELVERGFPQGARRGGVGEVGGDQPVTAARSNGRRRGGPRRGARRGSAAPMPRLAPVRRMFMPLAA